jgi:hypothetical protein
LSSEKEATHIAAPHCQERGWGGVERGGSKGREVLSRQEDLFQ